MTQIYNKIKEGVDPYQLQFDINGNRDIGPICEWISVEHNDQLTLSFTEELTQEEESVLDSLILLHTPVEAHFSISQLPFSRTLHGDKLAVHSSAKPEPEGLYTFAVWAGAGDDLSLPPEESLGVGDLLNFNCNAGGGDVVKDVKFDPAHGRVWIHEAYIKFENGGFQDYMTADVIAPGTPLQTFVDLNFTLSEDGKWVLPATGSPGGTHGLAGPPVLTHRTFSQDGDWDVVDNTLVPNFTGTGKYKMTAQETVVHRYFNRIPVYGTSATFTTMSSQETTELPVDQGYFIRVTAHNNSSSDWKASIIMEIYRQRTHVP